MWNDPDQELVQRLGPGEELLWQGRPQRGIHFEAMDIFFVPFSIVWCGFAIAWEFMALTRLPNGDGIERYFFSLFGAPFVAFGLYAAFGRFIVDSQIRDGTSYAVTNQRIIIVRSWFHKSIKSLDLKTLSDLTLSERSDASDSPKRCQEPFR